MAEITLDFSGGLNADADHMTCPKGQTIVMQEFYVDYGTLRRRFPSVKMKSTAIEAAAIDHCTAWQDSAQVQDPTKYIVVAVTNNKVYTGPWVSDANIVNQSTFITFTDRTNAVNIGKYPITSDVLNGNLVICSNNQPPVTLTAYNGNIAALGGTPPTGVCVKTVNNFMFISGTYYTGTTANFSTIRWSAASDPTTWPVASSLTFRLNDGDFIIALGALGQDLLIFKTNSIGRLFTTTTSVSGTTTLGPLITLWTGIGCCSPCGVDNLPDGRVVFIGSDANVYITDGSSLECISRRPLPHSSIYSGLTSVGLSSIGVTKAPYLKVYPTKHEIWVVPNASTNGSSGQAYIYDYFQNTWSYTAGYDLQCLGVLGPVRPSQTVGYPYRLMAGDSNTTGNVRLIEGTADDGLTYIAGTTTFTVPLVKELASFVPRSVVIPATLASTGANVKFGFDGTINSSYAYTLQTTKMRNVLAVKYLASSTAIRPLSFQIQISNAGTLDKFYPITISDQVLN